MDTQTFDHYLGRIVCQSKTKTKGQESNEPTCALNQMNYFFYKKGELLTLNPKGNASIPTPNKMLIELKML